MDERLLHPFHVHLVRVRAPHRLTNHPSAADEVTVKYDATYGFPTEATIDVVKEAIDDELYLTISNFEELS